MGRSGALVHGDTADGDDDANDGLVTYRPPGNDPAEGNDGTRLQVADDGTGYGSRLCDDEELGDVDQGGEQA